MGSVRILRAVGATTCAAGLLALAATASADVSPSSSDVTLAPGQSTQITKMATVPEIPAKVDVGMLIDLSSSYGNDLPNIRSAVGPLHDQVSAEADARFGVASFVDYPYNPWGSPPDPEFDFPGDYAYQRDLDMTADKSALQAAADGLDLRGGFDNPESQYEGLLQAATGAGRDVGDPGPSLGDVAAGIGLSFRPDATKVLVITTDAPFHTPDDSQCSAPAPCPFGYPGPSRNETVAALVTAGIKVIALKAPGSGPEMDDIAAATGGAVVTTDAQSSDIGAAILEGISQVLVDIEPDASSCAPIQVTFSPSSYEDVPSGESREFQETVTVPPGTPAGTYECTVDFGPAGKQTLRVTQPQREATRLEAEPALATVIPGLKVPLGRLEARLTRTGGVPVPGKTITMRVGTQTICAAKTDSNGVASCNGTFSGLLATVLNLGYKATFAGDAQLLGSSDEAPIVRVLGLNILRG